jgi:hypothetical protein
MYAAGVVLLGIAVIVHVGRADHLISSTTRPVEGAL